MAVAEARHGRGTWGGGGGEEEVEGGLGPDRKRWSPKLFTSLGGSSLF